MTTRNYAMEIATAFAKADSETLARIGYELLESLGEARANLAAFEAERARAREYDRERKRRVRRNPTESGGIPGPSPFSPTPPLNPTTSPSSSSARVLWHPADEARLAERLPSDHGRNALTSILARCGDKASVVAEFRMILDGGRPGVSHRPEHLESALVDYAANGMTDGRFNAAHFRKHVQRAARPEQTTLRRGGVGERSYQNAKEALGD